jgi:hypothetical protein
MTDLYFGDVLGSYANGVQLDLRVKLAVDFLKAAGDRCLEFDAARTATMALDLATELLDQAQARGLVKGLPEGNELSAPARAHIERMARAQVAGQVAAQGISEEEQPKVRGFNGQRLPGLS